MKGIYDFIRRQKTAQLKEKNKTKKRGDKKKEVEEKTEEKPEEAKVTDTGVWKFDNWEVSLFALNCIGEKMKELNRYY